MDYEDYEFFYDYSKSLAVERGIFSCGKLDPDAVPIPSDAVLPFYNHRREYRIKFKRGMTFIQSSPRPFKMEWVPFFETLSAQITAKIRKLVSRPFLSEFTFSFATANWLAIGPLYEYFDPFYYMLKQKMCISNRYEGKFAIDNVFPYSYGALIASTKRAYSKLLDAVIWIKWRSNIPGKDFILPYDAIELKPDDVTFEICETLPENLVQKYRQKWENEIDLMKWISVLGDDEVYDPPKRFIPKKCPTPFDTEYGRLTDYPDTTFVFRFKKEPNNDAVSYLEKMLFYCGSDYNIHDVMKVDVPDRFAGSEDEHRLVAFGVDFGGSSPPRALKSLVRKLQNYDLGIEKLTVI